MKIASCFGILAVAGMAVVATVLLTNHERSASAHQRWADADKLLYVPSVAYRENWVLLGSYSVQAEDPSKGTKELHVVYASPDTVRAYKKTGTFPDGAKLVKDVFATRTQSLTTGTVSFAQNLLGRFVMVKDSSNKYAGHSPLWGDGWGWAFYAKEEAQETITKNYKSNCLGCHEPARNQDLIFTQGYPVLAR